MSGKLLQIMVHERVDLMHIAVNLFPNVDRAWGSHVSDLLTPEDVQGGPEADGTSVLAQECIGDVVEHHRYADLVGLRGAFHVFPIGEEDHVQGVVADVDDGDVFPEVVRVILDVAKEYARALGYDPDVSADPAGVSVYPYVRRPYGVDDLPVIVLRVHSGRDAQYNVAVW